MNTNSLCHVERSETSGCRRIYNVLLLMRRISIIPVLAKVFQTGICCFNKVELFAPQPSLECFLSGNGRINVTERFEINQFVDVVFFGKSFDDFVLMFKNSFHEIIRQAYVKSSGFVCHNVNIVLSVISHVFYCNLNHIRRPDPSASPQDDEKLKALLGEKK